MMIYLITFLIFAGIAWYLHDPTEPPRGSMSGR
jgi:hypothetical protein